MIFCNGYLTFKDQLLNIIKNQRERDVPEFLKEFSVYDCIPGLRYSGGRVVPELLGEFNFDLIKEFNDQGVGIFPTLTNTVYQNLDDPLLHKVLRALNTCPLNGVILVQDDLLDLIKSEYKNIKISCSITGIKPFKTLSDLDIQALETKYDYICSKQNLYLDPEFYTRVNKPQYEILLNNACLWNCPYYKKHYRLVSKACVDLIDGKVQYSSVKVLNKVCFYHRHSEIFNLQELLNLGYQTFKFSLRTEPISEKVSCVRMFLKDLNDCYK